jgi:hypothetical protein
MRNHSSPPFPSTYYFALNTLPLFLPARAATLQRGSALSAISSPGRRSFPAKTRSPRSPRIASLLTFAEPRIDAIHHRLCEATFFTAHTGADEAHTETCLRHLRRSHGRRATARRVPRLVSSAGHAIRQGQLRLTTTQGSLDRIAAQTPARRLQPPVHLHYHQCQIPSAPSRTATRPTTPA